MGEDACTLNDSPLLYTERIIRIVGVLREVVLMKPLVVITGLVTLVNKGWKFDIGEDFELIRLQNEREVKVFFEQNKRSIELAVVGFSPVSTWYQHADQLTQWLKRFYSGPILAYSLTDREMRRAMDSGADCWCPTDEVPKIVKDILSRKLSLFSIVMLEG